MGLISIREEIHNKLLRLRSIDAIVSRPCFTWLWEDSDEIQLAMFHNLLAAVDRDGIQEWMRDHPSLELGERSLTDLKYIAQRAGVKNYSRKGKPELIRDIQEMENGPQ